jgi:pyrroline-5-carboxylate reductase
MDAKIGFIGAGAMAEALISGLLQARTVEPSNIIISEIAASRLDIMTKRYGISAADSNSDLVRKARTVILAVKPQDLRGVLHGLNGSFSNCQLVISIVTGITIAEMERMLPEKTGVIRVVPNTPCLVGEGVSVISLGSKALPEHQEIAEKLLRSVGQVFALPERDLDAVTGLSGSGPAYIYLVIEALTDAGVRVGLSRQAAGILAYQTVLGAAKMVRDTGKHPAELKDMVTSPGGTTITGLHVLEARGVRAALMDAVVAATDKARELRQKT